MFQYRWLIPLLLGAFAPSDLISQSSDSARGAQVRIKGDLRVDSSAHDDLILVIEGDAFVHGSAEAVVVINGNAVVDGGVVRDLTVIKGSAKIINGGKVTTAAHLIDATIDTAGGGSVPGKIEHGYSREILHGLFVFLALFAIGLTIAILAVGLIAAAVTPGPLVRAARLMTDEVGAVLVSALVVWVGIPLLAALLAATVIGIPAALGLLLMLLPLLGFLGFLVAGTRLGLGIMALFKRPYRAGKPYLAVAVGLIVLFIVGRIPVLGGLINTIATILGGGTVALLAWRAARQASRRPAVPNLEPAKT